MSALKKIVLALFVPLLYLNLAGMAAGAVWLAALSQWTFVGVSVALIFASPYVIPLLLAPANVFSHFMGRHQHTGRAQMSRAMFALSVAYVVFFFAFWCAGVFSYAVSGEEAGRAELLWGAAAALAPLMLWASQDRGNLFILSLLETAQAGVLILAAFHVFGEGLSFWPSAALLAGLLGLVAAIQAIYEAKTMGKTVC